MSESISLIPDWDQLYKQFHRNAQIHLTATAHAAKRGDHTTALADLVECVVSLNIMANSTANVEMVGQFRVDIHEVVKVLRSPAFGQPGAEPEDDGRGLL